MATFNNRLSEMQCKQFSFNPQYPFRLWKCVVRFVPVCYIHTHTDDLRQICAPLMYGNSTGCWRRCVYILGYRFKSYVSIRHQQWWWCYCCVLLAHFSPTVGHILPNTWKLYACYNTTITTTNTLLNLFVYSKPFSLYTIKSNLIKKFTLGVLSLLVYGICIEISFAMQTWTCQNKLTEKIGKQIWILASLWIRETTSWRHIQTHVRTQACRTNFNEWMNCMYSSQ